jgi:hypothetical protein
MWHLQVSRRELIEICLGAMPSVQQMRQTSAILVPGLGESTIHAYWDRQPKESVSLPILLIVPAGEIDELLTAIGAIPQLPSPFSSLCRVMTAEEARTYFSEGQTRPNRSGALLAAAVAMVEAILLSDGRYLLAQLSPAACKRTLAYVWGKALATGIPSKVIDDLLPRWLEAYELINAQAMTGFPSDTIASSAVVLRVCAALGSGATPDGAAGRLAYAMYTGDKASQEDSWKSLTSGLEKNVSLAELAALTREDRGTYLQQALRRIRTAADDSTFATCAFLATQVAPGSLQHLELLLGTRQPAIALWYGLFTALQSPNEVLAAEGGLGLRLLRDMTYLENQAAPPIADLGYLELRTVARLGLESISRKLGHISEVEVELIPLVTGSFSYASRGNRIRPLNHDQQLSLEIERGRISSLDPAYKERFTQILSALSKLIHELPEDPDRSSRSDHKVRKR